jgi:hypothetical protein
METPFLAHVPHAISVDPQNGTIYWADLWTETIHRGDMSGIEDRPLRR